VAQRIEQFDAPQDVFQAIVGNAARLNGNGSNAEDILHELNNNEDLASVSFMFLYLSCCCTFNIFGLYILMIATKHLYTSVTAFEFSLLSYYA
jgi:hypothetical protein